ncbi:hypothetical protein SAMN05443575_1335 [Jatrophihabitans endophyticus]|uniref:Uncharacterized protein n=1 Tax=Jatrophihabitans endophyticus TaxID=1206085 RepID=A0A1M5GYN3_9ACTN|nr:hypothetical protein [Jatrophihabitans endophyticus]SHG08829.1 hypothetical protein SAMN05443575_1335 [Jatrophihabitans endophyticus]
MSGAQTKTPGNGDEQPRLSPGENMIALAKAVEEHYKPKTAEKEQTR